MNVFKFLIKWMEFSSTFWYIWMIKYSQDLLINNFLRSVIQDYPYLFQQALNEE